MQKYLNNNKGFTLVEVIVVAVIVLILAAVAIPLYNGYIQDSRAGSVENAAGAIASGLGAAVQTGGQISATAEVASGETQARFTITPVGGGEVSYIYVPKRLTATIANGEVTVTDTTLPTTDTRRAVKVRYTAATNATQTPSVP